MMRTAAALVAAVSIRFLAFFPDVFEGIALQYDAYPQVVALGTDRAWTCSGVVVGVNTVITAAHCLEDPPTRLAIGSDPDLTDPISLADARVVRAYAADGHPLDVVAFVLPFDIRATIATIATAAEINSARELAIVGFGGRSADSRGGGLKRSGHVAMREAHCDPGSRYAGGCECVRGYVLVAEAGGACRGDSGGGAFVNGKLAGFISCFANDDNDCSRGRNLIVRADALREWIATLPGYRAPAAAPQTLPTLIPRLVHSD
jgi:hypothetical protein